VHCVPPAQRCDAPWIADREILGLCPTTATGIHTHRDQGTWPGQPSGNHLSTFVPKSYNISLHPPDNVLPLRRPCLPNLRIHVLPPSKHNTLDAMKSFVLFGKFEKLNGNAGSPPSSGGGWRYSTPLAGSNCGLRVRSPDTPPLSHTDFRNRRYCGYLNRSGSARLSVLGFSNNGAALTRDRDGQISSSRNDHFRLQFPEGAPVGPNLPVVGTSSTCIFVQARRGRFSISFRYVA